MKNALSSSRVYFLGLPLLACRGGLGCVELRLRLKQSMYISTTRPCPARRGAQLDNGEVALGVESHCGSGSFNCQCNIIDMSVLQCLRQVLYFNLARVWRCVGFWALFRWYWLLLRNVVAYTQTNSKTSNGYRHLYLIKYITHFLGFALASMGGP